MIDDTTATEKKPIEPPVLGRRLLALVGTAAVLWTAATWVVVERQIREQTAVLAAQETAEARQSLSIIGANLDRVLNRLQGIAAVLAAGSDVGSVLTSFGPAARPSTLSLEGRIAAWTRRPDLLALDRRLLAAKNDIGVDAIWVMNAAGDCVAASNFGDPATFVGTNYAFRAYFRSAQAGERGRQFAIGRVVKVPAMFYSAPVVVGGRFVGAVAIRNDLPRITSAINHPNAFVSDDEGVIFFAADRSLEMRALPGASVARLSDEQRLARYGRTTFETLDTRTQGGPGGLVFVGGSPDPHVWLRSELPQHGITAHILAPVSGVAMLRTQAMVVFVLVAILGTTLIALTLGVHQYLMRMRQHRSAIEASNRKLHELNEHLDRLAKIDPLTGCANSRHFRECAEAELGRARRYGRSCSVLALDVDFFKSVNDTYGHAGGDAALRHLARTMRAQLRAHDEVARTGGEEFTVLLPETDLKGALEVAERIRRAIEAAPAPFDNRRIALTASLGAACWNAPEESLDLLLQRADKALYAAKQGGRNRTEVAPGPRERVRPPVTAQSLT